MNDLPAQVLVGNRRAIARLLTWIENVQDGVEAALAALFPHTGRAWIIGVTGAPGTGKSSLVNRLALAFRQQEKTVGIIAVDPTSPFSGGAILGDRIRMRDLSGDTGVFIRSMATRGSLGGLARATRDAVRVLDAAGFDIVLVETVGAGQSEVDIVRTAQTTLVVEAPGLGDDVQAIKAGILEIADVLVVNKADHPGAEHTVRTLRMMLEMAARHDDSDATFWTPPVLQTVATTGDGIDALVGAMQQHQVYLREHPAKAQLEQQRIEIELYERLRESLLLRLLEAVPPQDIRAIARRIQSRDLDPQGGVERILELAQCFTHNQHVECLEDKQNL